MVHSTFQLDDQWNIVIGRTAGVNGATFKFFNEPNPFLMIRKRPTSIALLVTLSQQGKFNRASQQKAREPQVRLRRDGFHDRDKSPDHAPDRVRVEQVRV